MKVLITGGYGFIGSNLVRYWLEHYPDDQIAVLDSLTYAARPKWALDCAVAKKRQVALQKSDIRYSEDLQALSADWDLIFHLAAESHVCNSIKDPSLFMQTNVIGTFNLLQRLREGGFKGRFVHVSTDEVFGEAPIGSYFRESTQIAPRSPYAASKASSDHIALAYAHTYGLDVVVTNCSNNFGPNQHEEKLIPKTILALEAGDPVTLYGSGKQVRDWLWVDDHCRALDMVARKGVAGERYCVGGDNERSNLTIVFDLVALMGDLLGRPVIPKIIHTNDRPTDDMRYAVDCWHLKQLGWRPSSDFKGNLVKTVEWYLRGSG